VAAHFRVSRRTVQAWVELGEISHLNANADGRRGRGATVLRFKVEHVLEFEARRERKARHRPAENEAMWGRIEQLLRRLILDPARVNEL
jgi:hypothetical protein